MSGAKHASEQRRLTEKPIAFALRQAETVTSVAEVSRKMGVSEQTFSQFACARTENWMRQGREKTTFGHLDVLKTTRRIFPGSKWLLGRSTNLESSS